MREDQLPSPGLLTNGAHLRRTMAIALSYLAVNKRADGTHPSALKLIAFLDAAKVEAQKFDEAVPTNSVAPTVTGTARVGQTLTANNGAWAGSGLTYTYQWQKGVANIAGATNKTYVPVVGDVGSTLRCRVTATNAAGTLTVNTANTAAVIAA